MFVETNGLVYIIFLLSSSFDSIFVSILTIFLSISSINNNKLGFKKNFDKLSLIFFQKSKNVEKSLLAEPFSIISKNNVSFSYKIFFRFSKY